MSSLNVCYACPLFAFQLCVLKYASETSTIHWCCVITTANIFICAVAKILSLKQNKFLLPSIKTLKFLHNWFSFKNFATYCIFFGLELLTPSGFYVSIVAIVWYGSLNFKLAAGYFLRSDWNYKTSSRHPYCRLTLLL